MIDFLLKHYSFITHALEFLAAITAVFYYKKYKNVAAKYFIIFLLYVAICDSACYYTFYVRPNEALSFLIGTKFQKNHWFATLYWVIGAIIFYGFYFYKILKTPLYKNIIKYSVYIFLIFSLIYIALNWELFFVKFFIVLDVLGAIIILMCSIFYFFEILKYDKILEFYKSINFYISLTVFIWWLIITPLSFYSVYYTYDVGKNFLDLDFVTLRRQIFLFSNIFMYLTFTLALIFCKAENDNEKLN